MFISSHSWDFFYPALCRHPYRGVLLRRPEREPQSLCFSGPPWWADVRRSGAPVVGSAWPPGSGSGKERAGCQHALAARPRSPPGAKATAPAVETATRVTTRWPRYQLSWHALRHRHLSTTDADALLPFQRCVMFCGMNPSILYVSSILDWHQDIAIFFPLRNYCYHDHSWTWLLQCTYNSFSLVTTPGNVLKVKCQHVQFYRWHQNIFQSSCSSLEPPRQCIGVALLHILDYQVLSDCTALSVWCVWNEN